MFEIDAFYVFSGSYLFSMAIVAVYCIKKYSYDKALAIDMALLISTIPSCIWIFILAYWILKIHFLISLVLTFGVFSGLRYIADRPIINFKWIKNKIFGGRISKESDKKAE